MKKDLEIENGPWHFASSPVAIPPTITNTKTTTIMKTKLRPLTGAELAEARDRLHELNDAIEKAREEQVAIRHYLADRVHDGEEGAKTVTIDGIKLSVTRSLNRTISEAEADRFKKDHKLLAVAVLRFKPQLSIKEFKKHAELVEEYIETKLGIPTVVFK